METPYSRLFLKSKDLSAKKNKITIAYDCESASIIVALSLSQNLEKDDYSNENNANAQACFAADAFSFSLYTRIVLSNWHTFSM